MQSITLSKICRCRNWAKIILKRVYANNICLFKKKYYVKFSLLYFYLFDYNMNHCQGKWQKFNKNDIKILISKWFKIKLNIDALKFRWILVILSLSTYTGSDLVWLMSFTQTLNCNGAQECKRQWKYYWRPAGNTGKILYSLVN